MSQEFLSFIRILMYIKFVPVIKDKNKIIGNGQFNINGI